MQGYTLADNQCRAGALASLMREKKAWCNHGQPIERIQRALDDFNWNRKLPRRI
jgi:hypothetical protein